MKKYPITPLIIHTNKEDSLKITTTYDEDFDLWRINIEKDASSTPCEKEIKKNAPKDI